MKKKILILFVILTIFIVIGLVGKYLVDKKTEENKFNTEDISTVLTLEDEIQDDTVWCGTFQLIWNDLKNELAKQDIIFQPQLKVVENLNKEIFTTNDLTDKYYYKKIGTPSIELKNEIAREIKEKFNEKSNILDEFNWQNRDDRDYFLYVMLKKEFKFEKKFEELEKGKFGEYNNVKYFGISKNNKNNSLREQVDVIYYNSKEDFAIKLKTKQEDEIILCKNPQGNNFNQIYENIVAKGNEYTGDKKLKEKDSVKIPNISMKIKNEPTEIENKKFLFSNGETYCIERALQTIEVELDRTGGKIKSEAGIMNARVTSLEHEESRDFSLDNTFGIFLIEEGKDKPYFAGKISNITKFQ